MLNNLFFCFFDRFFVSVTQYPGSLKTHIRCPSGSFTRPNPWCMDAYVNCVPPGKENQGQEKHLNHLPFITHWVAKKKNKGVHCFVYGPSICVRHTTVSMSQRRCVWGWMGSETSWLIRSIKWKSSAAPLKSNSLSFLPRLSSHPLQL